MSTRKRAATSGAAKPKAIAPEDILPGYQFVQVAVGPNVDGLDHQAAAAQTLPTEEEG